jgi:thiol:disulfide interchange protein DsbC
MLDSKTPLRNMGRCDTSALERIAALGRKHRVTGTPTLVFESGTRISGALTASEMEKQLTAAEAEKSSSERKR